MERRRLPIFSAHSSRILTFQDAGLLAGHGMRSVGALRHIDRSKSTLNEVWAADPNLSPSDLVGQIKSAARRQNAVFRKSASVALELLVWGTREAWELGGERLRREFIGRVKSLACRLYGEESVAAIRVDADEPNGQVHGSAFIVPVSQTMTKLGFVKRAVSAKRAIDGYNRDNLKQHGKRVQDAVFETFREFGVVRGIASDRKQIPPAILRKIGQVESDISIREAEADAALRHAEDAQRTLAEEATRSRRLSQQLEFEQQAAADAARRARTAEAGALAAKKKAEREEAEARAKAEELNVREKRIEAAERMRTQAEAEIEEGFAAWADGQAEPLPDRGAWEIRRGTPDARVRALRGRFGRKIWDRVVEITKSVAVRAEKRFAGFDFARLLHIYGNAPGIKRARMLGELEALTPQDLPAVRKGPTPEPRPSPPPGSPRL